MQPLLLLIPFLPFVGFLVNGIGGKKLSKTTVGIIGSGVLLLSLVLSVMCFFEIANTEQGIHSAAYTFLTVGDLHFQFSFWVDRLSVWMMLIVTGIGFLIHVYSIGYMHDDAGFHRFFAYLNLFIFSMLLLVMGSNMLVLFMGWEGVGLCSYLLIGFWYENKSYGYAARKAFIMNRIGDLGLLLGMFLMMKIFGTLEFQEIFSRLPALRLSENTLTLITLLLFVGAIGKSAQIPLYTWLPDAMAGPTPVSALIHAATMVTAGIYLVVRCHPLFSLSPTALYVIAVVGMVTSLLSALIGLRQNDIKKVLAYSTVSQLGLMFVALGMGAYVSAMFHLTTHAFFKALLFLAAGSVIHGLGGEQDIRRMGGLRTAMPITFWVFLIGTFAISGFPLLSGFFSKDEIFANTWAAGGKLWWGIAGLGGLITAIYMTRLLYVTFFGTFRGSEAQRQHLHESPATMVVPLVVLAALSVFGGLLNAPHIFHLPHAQWLASWLEPVVKNNNLHHGGAPHHLAAHVEWSLMLFTSSVAVAVIVVSYFVYKKGENLPVEDARQTGWTRWLAQKLYVDEIYDFLFVRPIEQLSRLMHYYLDVWAIDGIVNSIGSAFFRVGNLFRRLQNGNIEYYLLGMVAGAVLILLNLFL